MAEDADRRNLVGDAAERLRDRVFASAPGDRIGSLADLTAILGVGTVTVQQAVRVLEHEGLIAARRGPGGGYYGTRPDERAVERALSAYLRARPATFGEALDITSLLFTELAAAAARGADDAAREALAALAATIDGCDSDAERGIFEARFQDLLFRMVDRPLFELITHVTLRFAASQAQRVVRADADGAAAWKAGRHRILAAIGSGDAELARFEADRGNRRAVLAGLIAAEAEG